MINIQLKFDDIDSETEPGNKIIHYEYDFAGNVINVIYQNDETDDEERFDHVYEYDADGRLSEVKTTEYEADDDPATDNPVTQAKYKYYLHGPLKRTELGGDLQGIDYVYNINGWLKSINNPALDGKADGYVLDPGADGFSGDHSGFNKDVFGMTLDYYNRDYERTGGWGSDGYIDIEDAARGTYINYGDPETPDLFNGNIKSVRWRIKDQDLEENSPQLPVKNTHWAYAYDYNEKNWLNEAEFGIFKPDYTINQGIILDLVEHTRAAEAISDKVENNASYPELTRTALEAIQSDPEFDSQNNNFYNIYGLSENVPDDVVADFVENDIPEYFNINKGISAALAEFDLVPWIPEVSPYFNPDDDDAYHVWDLDYDKNGNINTLKRNAYKVDVSVDMDKLTYNYDPEKKNRLVYIDDEIGSSALNDIDDQGANNYSYNFIGQMTGNVEDGHYFKYDVYGKVTGVYSNSSCTTPIALYKYDDKGYRVKKEDYVQEEATWYIRDAAGNIMYIYDEDWNDPYDITKKQIPVYGASRIGVAEICTTGVVDYYVYELTDHLGNVRATIRDNSGLEILSHTDYYPFGMEMPGRQLIPGEGQYRFAYQGQFAERDQETGYNQFTARLYDNRTGRWMIPDPAGQFASPYLGMGNNPVMMVDEDGELAWFVVGAVALYSAYRGYMQAAADPTATWVDKSFGTIYGGALGAFSAALISIPGPEGIIPGALWGAGTNYSISGLNGIVYGNNIGAEQLWAAGIGALSGGLSGYLRSRVTYETVLTESQIEYLDPNGKIMSEDELEIFVENETTIKEGMLNIKDITNNPADAPKGYHYDFQQKLLYKQYRIGGTLNKRYIGGVTFVRNPWWGGTGTHVFISPGVTTSKLILGEVVRHELIHAYHVRLGLNLLYGSQFQYYTENAAYSNSLKYYRNNIDIIGDAWFKRYRLNLLSKLSKYKNSHSAFTVPWYLKP